MKPFVENVLLEESFNWLVKRYHCEVPLEEFACPWHYHTEYELVFYLDSDGIFEGKYFAGDAIGTTSHNTLLLYGPGLPHMVAGQSTSHVAKPLHMVQSSVDTGCCKYDSRRTKHRSSFRGIKVRLALLSKHRQRTIRMPNRIRAEAAKVPSS